MRAYDGIIKAMAIATLFMVFLLAIGITFGAVSRYAFNRSLASIVEMSTYALLYITFLAAPWVLRQDGHVKVDFLNYILGRRWQTALDVVASLLSLALTAFLTWAGMDAVYRSYVSREVVANILQTPAYLLLWVIPVGMAFLALGFGRLGVLRLREFRSGPSGKGH